VHDPTVKRLSIAVGPITAQPSWSWVGLHVLRELATEHRVAAFASLSTPPPCDVLFVVKTRPTADFVERALHAGTRVVYLPIDVYRSRDEIAADATILRRCAAVLSHSERLLAELAPYCRRLQLVEHHLKYRLDTLAPFKERGDVLWIGGFQYVPYLLRWLHRHPLDAELTLLTDVDDPRAVAAAGQLAGTLDLDVELRPGMSQVGGHSIVPWSEDRQASLLATCKAALDVKHESDFNQIHKPPTKAQKFVASGIPLAVNEESSAYEYFMRRGFPLAVPTDPARWLARPYWEETRAVAADLRRALASKAVGSDYRRLVAELCATGDDERSAG
jgi:hypothetical protein